MVLDLFKAKMTSMLTTSRRLAIRVRKIIRARNRLNHVIKSQQAAIKQKEEEGDVEVIKTAYETYLASILELQHLEFEEDKNIMLIQDRVRNDLEKDEDFKKELDKFLNKHPNFNKDEIKKGLSDIQNMLDEDHKFIKTKTRALRRTAKRMRRNRQSLSDELRILGKQFTEYRTARRLKRRMVVEKRDQAKITNQYEHLMDSFEAVDKAKEEPNKDEVMKQINQLKSAIRHWSKQIEFLFLSAYKLILLDAKQHIKLIDDKGWLRKDLENLKTKEFPSKLIENFEKKLDESDDDMNEHSRIIYRMQRTVKRQAA